MLDEEAPVQTPAAMRDRLVAAFLEDARIELVGRDPKVFRLLTERGAGMAIILADETLGEELASLVAGHREGDLFIVAIGGDGETAKALKKESDHEDRRPDRPSHRRRDLLQAPRGRLRGARDHDATSGQGARGRGRPAGWQARRERDPGDPRRPGVVQGGAPNRRGGDVSTWASLIGDRMVIARVYSRPERPKPWHGVDEKIIASVRAP